jgi:lipoate-protein ligase A
MTPDWSNLCHTVAPAQEQRWNEEQLAHPVLRPTLRFWQYQETALVLGCSQRSLLAMLPDEALPVLVRQAGGGAVLVGPWMLSLSLLLPNNHRWLQDSLPKSYRPLGQALAQGLQSLGIAAQAADPTPWPGDAARDLNPPPILQVPGKVRDWACFASLGPWEVLAGGRKLVGLAQVRRRTGCLLTAGVLVGHSPWPQLCRGMGRPVTSAHHLADCTTSVSAQRGQVTAANDVFPACAAAVLHTLQTETH